MEKVRQDVGRDGIVWGVRGGKGKTLKNMLFGSVGGICSLFLGNLPGGATV